MKKRLDIKMIIIVPVIILVIVPVVLTSKPNYQMGQIKGLLTCGVIALIGMVIVRYYKARKKGMSHAKSFIAGICEVKELFLKEDNKKER